MICFEIVLICFIFCVNFIQMANGQTCSNDNQLGVCAKLSCPPERNGKTCVKRRCVKNDESPTPNVAAISSIAVGVFVVFAIIIVVAVIWIRSRRYDPDRKLSVRSAKNPYTFRNFPPTTMTELADSSQRPRPPLSPWDDEDENPYEYETVDFPERQPSTTNTTVQDTENGYLIPSALTKPNLPPPKIWDPTC